MANDERAVRAARNIAAGIRDAGRDLGLAYKPEGEPSLVAAIIEAIENEYSPSSALVGEVAERVAGAARIAEYQASEKGQSVEGINIAKAAIVPVLADFKRAIELNARGKVVVAESELAKLIEEARKWTTFFACVENRPDLAGCFNGLRTALERQIAARRAAEDRALPDSCVPMLNSTIEALDIYINQLRGQIETARVALSASRRFADMGALKRGPLAMMAAAVKNHCDLALAQLDNPTESGEPIHDWSWALTQLRQMAHVRHDRFASDCYLYLHPYEQHGGRYIMLHNENGEWNWQPQGYDFNAVWQLVEPVQNDSAKSEVSDEG